MAEDDSSTLVILLETHSNLWSSPVFSSKSSSYDPLSPADLIDQILNFCKAFLLVSEGNKLAIFAVHHNSSPLLYASPGLSTSNLDNAHTVPLPGLEVKERLVKLIQQKVDPNEGPALAGSLSRVLCFLHKIKQRTGVGREKGKKPRILCLQASTDVSVQYISFMNAIFSAERGDCVIDACMLGSHDSALLQQACHLTKGIYARPKRMTALLQYLLTIYLGDTHSRSFLMLPSSGEVDYRASCFCHKAFSRVFSIHMILCRHPLILAMCALFVCPFSARTCKNVLLAEHDFQDLVLDSAETNRKHVEYSYNAGPLSGCIIDFERFKHNVVS